LNAQAAAYRTSRTSSSRRDFKFGKEYSKSCLPIAFNANDPKSSADYSLTSGSSDFSNSDVIGKISASMN